MTGTKYQQKLEEQICQYREVENIHDLPDIFHYWSNKHLRPRLLSVMGVETIADFYAVHFKTAIAESRNSALLSVGAGDCSVEIAVAKRLRALGVNDFTLTCLEVSPHLLERAEAAVAQDGLRGIVVPTRVDINRWRPSHQVAGVMANHSLHHFVELEQVFEGIKQCMADEAGVFVTNDMIGRNGHMRWPEALEIVESIWGFMPYKYKHNRQLERIEKTFVNWDCSNEGFEGVRVQDILPLLNKTFGFESFLGFGGIVDVFVDRAFGHNLDPVSESDRSFVDFVQLLNDRLIDGGIIKPTTMFAVMSKSLESEPKQWRHWGPRFSERPV